MAETEVVGTILKAENIIVVMFVILFVLFLLKWVPAILNYFFTQQEKQMAMFEDRLTDIANAFKQSISENEAWRDVSNKWHESHDRELKEVRSMISKKCTKE